MSPPLRRGDPWGSPAPGPPDDEIWGDDRALAAFAENHPGGLVRFVPSPASDLGRAVGLAEAAADRAPGTTAVTVDALRVEGSELAMNAVVFGRPPDRLGWATRALLVTVALDGREWFRGPATSIVIASGQHLRGLDLVPRGHPGDGWAEVQVYALRRAERAAMRRRLRSGTHVPHPRIRQGRARRIEVRSGGRAWALELDGVPLDRVREAVVAIVPGAIRLLV